VDYAARHVDEGVRMVRLESGMPAKSESMSDLTLLQPSRVIQIVLIPDPALMHLT
jgi:hypothetical protein